MLQLNSYKNHEKDYLFDFVDSCSDFRTWDFAWLPIPRLKNKKRPKSAKNHKGLFRSTTNTLEYPIFLKSLMSHLFLRISVIFFLTLLFMIAGCESGFKKKAAPGSYAYQKKEFKKMVENDPFPTANQSF